MAVVVASIPACNSGGESVSVAERLQEAVERTRSTQAARISVSETAPGSESGTACASEAVKWVDWQAGAVVVLAGGNTVCAEALQVLDGSPGAIPALDLPGDKVGPTSLLPLAIGLRDACYVLDVSGADLSRPWVEFDGAGKTGLLTTGEAASKERTFSKEGDTLIVDDRQSASDDSAVITTRSRVDVDDDGRVAQVETVTSIESHGDTSTSSTTHTYSKFGEDVTIAAPDRDYVRPARNSTPSLLALAASVCSL
ncbi:hypothetical protein NHL50_13400 [Acidimicrobiia bacterium EGI L10123]|uniref:hypothetical protein n=1 Tax=Salinilacustrithrix flava TaxID=2957203 RepID=UPI003D7C2F35|nr:hypothetical protein [Acidimicrobiia bacterium EGI L10123]